MDSRENSNRKHLGFENSVIRTRPKKCKLDSTCNVRGLEIPNNLNQWERHQIEFMNISLKFLKDVTPLELIQRGEVKCYEQANKISEIKQYVQKSCLMSHLKGLGHTYTCFNELSSEDLWFMAPEDDEKISNIPPWTPEYLIVWFYRFHSQAHDFSNKLHLILRRKENGAGLHESHFKSLFESFASMFGLNSCLSSGSCLDLETRKIMNRDVTGCTDIVFSARMFSPLHDVIPGTQHPRVVAVCQVTKNTECSDSPSNNIPHTSSSPLNSSSRNSFNFKNSPMNSSDSPVISSNNPVNSSNNRVNLSNNPVNSSNNPVNSSNNPVNICRNSLKSVGEIPLPVSESVSNCTVRQQDSPPHLDDRVIGQHVGQLLFHFPETVKVGTIIGLIVQQTQVTFTSLEITKEQYDDLVLGQVNFQDENPPILKYTKSYDYLKTEDREFLVEAFIKLAILQRTIL